MQVKAEIEHNCHVFTYALSSSFMCAHKDTLLYIYMQLTNKQTSCIQICMYICIYMYVYNVFSLRGFRQPAGRSYRGSRTAAARGGTPWGSSAGSFRGHWVQGSRDL